MTSPVLHGRQGPLQRLRDALGAARQGRGQLVLVSGDAGIGKSALATAFAGEAEAAGTRVTWGRAWEFADAPPYFPVWPCLRALGIDASGGDGEDQAFRLWERVLAALARAGEPLVWVVEDLHAADLGTIDLLTFLVQPLRALRVLVVATTRQQDARLTDRKLRRLARMARDGVEVPLAPLAESDVVALAEQTSGRALPPTVAHRLLEVTGGNPLFVVECARASSRAGWIEDALAALPPTVRQVVLDRVALLPDATRDALASGAVLGREFTAAAVARMHDSEPARVGDTLLPAVRAGILREVRPDRLAFSHALVCDAVYEAISQAERVRLHGRADLALATRGDGADVLVERARHALAAAAGGEPQRALAAAGRATELLEREGAFDRAFALHLKVQEARAAGFLPPATRAELLHVARIAREAGRADATRKLCEEVLASARGAGDAEAFARAALLHAAEVRVAVIDPRQIALLEEAHRLLGDWAPGLACRVLARLSTALQPADEPEGPTEMARQALRAARATGEPAAILDVLDLAGLGAYYTPVAERITWAEELRDRALAAGDVGKALTAWTWLAFWHMETGDFAAFQRDAANALDLSARAGHPRLRWGPLLLASGNALALGRFDESDRYLMEVSQIAALIDEPGLALSLVNHEIMRARLQRRPEELRRAFARLDGVMEGVKRKEEFVALIRAAGLSYLKDVEATAAELARIDLGSATREGDAEPLGLLAEAVALAGDDEQRRYLRSRLAGVAPQQMYGSGVSFTYEGTVGRVIGLLDAALGDLPAAEARLREALEGARARRHTPWVAQVAHELAAVLRRAGRASEAQALQEESSAVARELGLGALPGTEGPAVEEQEPVTPFRMQRLGDVWTIERQGRLARVKDSRGMHLLARLADRPGEEIHVLALASDAGASLAESDAGEMLDQRARTAYRHRLAEIDVQLAAAEAAGDADSTRRLAREKRALAGELARATGLSGRARLAGSATERARINVQRRLKVAIGRVGAVDPELGRFLSRAVCTGTYCCFRQ